LIENEFDILVPISNAPNKIPSYIVIAFSSPTKVSLGVPGYHYVRNSFRIFGATVKNTVAPLPVIAVINGLANQADATLDANFAADWKETGTDDFKFEIDTTLLKPTSDAAISIKSTDSTVTFTSG